MKARSRTLILALLTSLVAGIAPAQEKGAAPSGAPPLPEPIADPAARAAAAAVQEPRLPPVPPTPPAPEAGVPMPVPPPPAARPPEPGQLTATPDPAPPTPSPAPAIPEDPPTFTPVPGTRPPNASSGPVSSTSTSGQFVVYGDDLRVRSILGTRCEETSRALSVLLRDQDPWILPIIVLLSNAKEPPKPGDHAVTVSISQLEQGGFHLQVNVQVREDLRPADFRRELVRVLLAERVLRKKNDASPVRQPLVPEWMVNGVVDAMDYRQRSRPSALFGAVFKSGKIYGIEEIISATPGELDALSRTIYDTSCCALVLTLLDQPEGGMRLGKLLAALGTDPRPERELLNQWFPNLAKADSSLNKWWSLQMASLAQPGYAETMDPTATMKALREATTLRFEAPAKDAPKPRTVLPPLPGEKPALSPTMLAALAPGAPAAAETPPAPGPAPAAVEKPAAPSTAPKKATAAPKKSVAKDDEAAEPETEEEASQRPGFLSRMFGRSGGTDGEEEEAEAKDKPAKKEEPKKEPEPEPKKDEEAKPEMTREEKAAARSKEKEEREAEEARMKAERDAQREAEAKAKMDAKEKAAEEERSKDEAKKKAADDKKKAEAEAKAAAEAEKARKKAAAEEEAAKASKGSGFLRGIFGGGKKGEEDKADEDEKKDQSSVSPGADSPWSHLALQWWSPSAAATVNFVPWAKVLPESQPTFLGLKFGSKKAAKEGEEEAKKEEPKPQPKAKATPKAGSKAKANPPAKKAESKAEPTPAPVKKTEEPPAPVAAPAAAPPSPTAPPPDVPAMNPALLATPTFASPASATPMPVAPPAGSVPATPPALTTTQPGMVLVELPIEDYDLISKRPDRVMILKRNVDALSSLVSRGNVLFRPVLNDYLSAVADISNGKTKGMTERLAVLRQRALAAMEKGRAVRDHLDWFEASQTTRYSGIFEDYLHLPETLKHETPPRTDPISEYLDALDKEFSE